VANRCVEAVATTAVSRDYTLDACATAGEWVRNGLHDQVWQQSHGDYDFIAWRDADAAAAVYGVDTPRYRWFRLNHRGRPVAWAVALATPMTGHRYFGDLRVGTLVDCGGLARHATALVARVSEALAPLVDVIISNQSARVWGEALRRSGYREGPSNFLFAASPRLAAQLAPLPGRLDRLHLTRGDGDGPINL
jgi:hypothetical protein